MNVKQPISVFISDLPENELIIFKLIFSVSERTRNRNHFYSRVEDKERASIEIVPGKSEQNDTGMPNLGRISVVDSPESIKNAQIILRPIIASRVLSVLDKYVADSNTELNKEQPTLILDKTDIVTEEEKIESKLDVANIDSPSLIENTDHGSDEADDFGYVAALDSSGEFEFSISEEDASKLAIVHDEELSNPANNDPVIPETDHTIQTLHNVTELADIENNKVISTRVDSGEAPIKRALVVDDSASVRKQLEIELKLFNVNVDYAEDAERAFDLLHKNNYDVAFLDVVLPDQDGYTICKSIKTNSEMKRMKVIMLTGKSTYADKVRGSLAGCDAYLVKPVGRLTFQNTAKHYLPIIESVKAMEA
jgi:CheY-like chemotaxis protein